MYFAKGDWDACLSEVKADPWMWDWELKVGGGLNLYGTQIKELPQGLKVGGYLDLRDTQIKELPQALKVKDKIYVTDKSKIKCSDELRKKLSWCLNQMST